MFNRSTVARSRKRTSPAVEWPSIMSRLSSASNSAFSCSSRSLAFNSPYSFALSQGPRQIADHDKTHRFIVLRPLKIPYL
jgi:hypothetical protein